MKISIAFISAIFFLIAVSGCSRYEKMVLTPGVVTQRLSPPDMANLRIEARQIKHPLLRPVEIDEHEGITPDGAAILAVLLNPKLVSERDKKGVAEAQLLQAGILPNPVFSYSVGVPIGGITGGTVNTHSYGLSYDIRALVMRGAEIGAAGADLSSVELSIAWQEWQVAQSAKSHAYRLILLKKQLAAAGEEAKAQEENFAAVKKATDMGDSTLVQLSAAQASLDRVRLLVITTEQSVEQERLALNDAVGLPPDYVLNLRTDVQLPGLEHIPSLEELFTDLEEKRIDLAALKMGYESQEEKLRAAILGQFPKLSMGPVYASDTTPVITTGLSLTADVPIFDRNQGNVAKEKATRQQLFDEYVSRLFEARSKLSTVRANIISFEAQINATREAEAALENLAAVYGTALLEGNADALTYYNAVDELITKRLAELGLELQLADEIIALETESGGLIKQL